MSETFQVYVEQVLALLIWWVPARAVWLASVERQPTRFNIINGAGLQAASWHGYRNQEGTIQVVVTSRAGSSGALAAAMKVESLSN